MSCKIGDALLRYMMTTVWLGHQSPAETLGYHHRTASTPPETALVSDAIDWISGRKKIPGSEDRVRAFIQDSGLLHVAANTL